MSLIAKNLRKKFTYPNELDLLKGIDLEVSQGESVAIVGRSGEGKSTLLYILGTLDTPTSGTVTIAGKEVNSHSVAAIRSKHIGFIFQSFHLLEDYSVLQNVLMPASIARKPIGKGSDSCVRAEELLIQVGLKDRMGHFGKQLSGGEKQRVAIARALCNNPDILFADEPSGNLDKKTAEGIHSLLLDFTKQNNKTLIVVTHDDELAKLCSSRYRLSHGTLEESI